MSDLSVEDARQIVERMKLFAQPQRLLILDALLSHGPLSVGELESRTGIGQPTLSQQLGTLRRADIVMPRRDSRTIYYSLASPDDALRARALIGLLHGGQSARAALQALAQHDTDDDKPPRPAAAQNGAPGPTAQPPTPFPYAEGGAQFALVPALMRRRG
ncbi:metalloregulator ArsR/SmtB family transcription factor [Acetobacter sp. TBRC 12305]|uniref:Winged helix-turn-helix transcriptional regulator n=1 Tax=Acetobacter garciniae TaxID=2817435 RepID=A0A939HLJ8_9PROT|nr:metalloregulator ArsR/SmtB family transcription factor [Acetobacter garciniae]MBO1324990.1 winged helix-turn-helix transcriptional regulator [Acetobacter garciniae]MBX0344681.1 metalloregulator ArsR/SmtB family transcription factor [Acetobacter garciniae]